MWKCVLLEYYVKCDQMSDQFYLKTICYLCGFHKCIMDITKTPTTHTQEFYWCSSGQFYLKKILWIVGVLEMYIIIDITETLTPHTLNLFGVSCPVIILILIRQFYSK